MSGGLFENKDVSLLLSIKPHMSPQGQKTIDILLSMIEVVNDSKSVVNNMEGGLDIKSINRLIRSLNQE